MYSNPSSCPAYCERHRIDNCSSAVLCSACSHALHAKTQLLAQLDGDDDYVVAQAKRINAMYVLCATCTRGNTALLQQLDATLHQQRMADTMLASRDAVVRGSVSQKASQPRSVHYRSVNNDDVSVAEYLAKWLIMFLIISVSLLKNILDVPEDSYNILVMTTGVTCLLLYLVFVPMPLHAIRQRRQADALVHSMSNLLTDSTPRSDVQIRSAHYMPILLLIIIWAITSVLANGYVSLVPALLIHLTVIRAKRAPTDSSDSHADDESTSEEEMHIDIPPPSSSSSPPPPPPQPVPCDVYLQPPVFSMTKNPVISPGLFTPPGTLRGHLNAFHDSAREERSRITVNPTQQTQRTVELSPPILRNPLQSKDDDRAARSLESLSIKGGVMDKVMDAFHRML